MFQFSAFASLRMHGLQPCGFPHSEIQGSICICHSPWLIAAYHVFLRLSKPRHPPCALSNLLVFFTLLLFLLLQSIPICQRTLQWRITDSNRWPPACKAGALASWANPPILLPTSSQMQWGLEPLNFLKSLSIKVSLAELLLFYFYSSLLACSE